MMRRIRRQIQRLPGGTAGAAAVEFAVIATVLLLFLGGVIDFGHAWYMQQTITNASREGARYGIRYSTYTTGARRPPSALSPSIQTYVISSILSKTWLPADSNPQVALAGAGLGTGTSGADLEVTVQAVKHWYIIPGLGPTKNLSATTVMKCE